MSVPPESTTQYQLFLDCVFTTITEKLDPPTRKPVKSKNRRSSRKASLTSISDNNTSTSTSLPDLDPTTLSDFAEYIANEIFLSLPATLQRLTHTSSLSADYTPPLTATTIDTLSTRIPPEVTDTLSTYCLTTPPKSDITSFLSPILYSYITTLTTPPPPPSSTRPDSNACELCARTWLPLTYHHLIPKSTHQKALKRGWHEESALGNVAWLCRACHSWVHRQAGNEELAREYWSMELVRGMEGFEGWVGWVGSVRWKKR